MSNEGRFPVASDDGFDSTAERTVREAARVVLLDSVGRVLLFPFRVPLPDDRTREVWITPGGGLEGGETHEACAARELWEETGLRAEIGPCIWTRTHTLRWGDRIIEQRERYYIARATNTEVDATNWTEMERELLGEHRWWSCEEITASRAYFAPRSLSKALPSLIAGEYPAVPIDIGV